MGDTTGRTAEQRVIDATKSCWERYGISKVTVDDISAASGVSRATIYRLFPGGRDVVFDALRVRELTDFFDRLTTAVDGARSLDDLVVLLVSAATRELRADGHVAIMLATEPGDTLGQLTVDGLPRILRVASAYLQPMLDPYLEPTDAEPLIDLLVRLTISYFLAPSDRVDLADPAAAEAFLRPFLTALTPTHT